MDKFRSGASIFSPPLFDGDNYPHWKARMMFFLQMQDERVWNAVEYGWTHPVKLDAQGLPT